MNKVNTGFDSSWLFLEYACISQRSPKCFRQNLQCSTRTTVVWPVGESVRIMYNS